MWVWNLCNFFLFNPTTGGNAKDKCKNNNRVPKVCGRFAMNINSCARFWNVANIDQPNKQPYTQSDYDIYIYRQRRYAYLGMDDEWGISGTVLRRIEYIRFNQSQMWFWMEHIYLVRFIGIINQIRPMIFFCCWYELNLVFNWIMFSRNFACKADFVYQLHSVQ